jgi:hypothetical protein
MNLFLVYFLLHLIYLTIDHATRTRTLTPDVNSVTISEYERHDLDNALGRCNRDLE